MQSLLTMMVEVLAIGFGVMMLMDLVNGWFAMYCPIPLDFSPIHQPRIENSVYNFNAILDMVDAEDIK